MISVIMFLFLANWRIMLVAALSIPFVYLGTISLMWLFVQEINMVTLAKVSLPPGVRLSQAGDIKEMKDSLIRIFAAILMGLLLLYAVLVPTFKSWKAPLAIMLAIPLSLIWGAWSLLLTDKHMCLPAIMGFVLLSGIIVKNSILLIDFTEEALVQGMHLREALLQSVTLRTRAILMTAFARDR